MKKRKERADADGGETYRHLSTIDTDGTSASNISDDISDEGDVEENDQNDFTKPASSGSESFRVFMGKQLQFDIRMAGIAGLFVIQKNLLFLGISNLDTAIFQVTYQGKILTTAVFSVLLLNKELRRRQIIGLVLLTMGVVLVQLDKVGEDSSKSYQEQNKSVGLLAVFGACCTSGFAGVYFELVLKPKNTNNESFTPPPSVWAKNVQLSTFALIIGLATSFVNDGSAIVANGFFQGYSPVVIAVILLQAFGGLVVAAVVKYADNILKSFATALSIVSSTLISAWAFGFSISTIFVLGCLLQFVAMRLYATKDDSVDSTSMKDSKLSTQTSDKALMPLSPGTAASSGFVVVEMQLQGTHLFRRCPSN